MQNRRPWLPQEVERLSCRNRLVSSVIKVLLQIVSPKPLNQYNQWDAGAPLTHHPHPPSSSFPKYSSIRAWHWWLTAHSQVPLWELSLAQDSHFAQHHTLSQFSTLPMAGHLASIQDSAGPSQLHSSPMGLAKPLL